MLSAPVTAISLESTPITIMPASTEQGGEHRFQSEYSGNKYTTKAHTETKTRSTSGKASTSAHHLADTVDVRVDKIREDVRRQHREQLHRWGNVQVGHMLSDEDEDDDRIGREALQRQRQGADGGPWEEP